MSKCRLRRTIRARAPAPLLRVVVPECRTLCSNRCSLSHAQHDERVQAQEDSMRKGCGTAAAATAPVGYCS
eukprot:1157969-Pelagomonas_calceolata.AAC.7